MTRSIRSGCTGSGGSLLVSRFSAVGVGTTSFGLTTGGAVLASAGAAAVRPLDCTTSNGKALFGAGFAAGALACGSRNVCRDWSIRFIAFATLGSEIPPFISGSVGGTISALRAAPPFVGNDRSSVVATADCPPLRCCTAFCNCSRQSGSDEFLF